MTYVFKCDLCGVIEEEKSMEIQEFKDGKCDGQECNELCKKCAKEVKGFVKSLKNKQKNEDKK